MSISYNILKTLLFFFFQTIELDAPVPSSVTVSGEKRKLTEEFELNKELKKVSNKLLLRIAF